MDGRMGLIRGGGLWTAPIQWGVICLPSGPLGGRMGIVSGFESAEGWMGPVCPWFEVVLSKF